MNDLVVVKISESIDDLSRERLDDVLGELAVLSEAAPDRTTGNVLEEPVGI